MRGLTGPFRGVAARIVYANMQRSTQKPSTPNMSESESELESELDSELEPQSVRR